MAVAGLLLVPALGSGHGPEAPSSFFDRIFIPDFSEYGFGESVDIENGVAVVGDPRWGSPWAAGRAIVLELDGATWTPTATLQSSLPQGVWFGGFVDTDGARIAVSGSIPDIDFYRSAVFVFARDADGNWFEEDVIVPAPDSPDSSCCTVAISGDTLLAGSSQDASMDPDGGIVDVYVRGDTGMWSHTATWSASDAAAGDEFGTSIALDGDVAVVGALLRDEGEAADAGAAYVFERDADGAWDETALLLAAPPTAGEAFGMSVAVSGDVVAVRAPYGSAHLFRRAANGAWAPEARLTPQGGGIAQLSLDGGTILVGRELFVHREGTWNRLHYTLTYFGPDAAIDGSWGIATRGLTPAR